MKNILTLVLFVFLMWIASYYGHQGALLPPIWWVVAVVVLFLLFLDVVKGLKK